MPRKLTPITPGEILLMEFIKPLGISQSRLARDLSVPVRRVNDIVQGNRPITADTALRLAVYFNMTPEFWMNLQSHYDLKVAKRNLLPKIARSIRPAEKKAA
jgi:antitoxin HigA-1